MLDTATVTLLVIVCVLMIFQSNDVGLCLHTVDGVLYPYIRTPQGLGFTSQSELIKKGGLKITL